MMDRLTGTEDVGELMALEARLDRIARHASEDRHYGLVLIDVAGLEEINTQYGRLLGDQVLIELARRLRLLSREAFIARVDSDKFALLVDGMNQTAVSQFGNQLQHSLNSTSWSFGNDSVPVHVRATSIAGPSSDPGETRLLWAAQRAQRSKGLRDLRLMVADLESSAKFNGLQAEVNGFLSQLAISISRHDELTGLLDRHGYADLLPRLAAPYALAFLDIDNLRDLNKTPGLNWEAGDYALRSVARMLETLSSEGTAIRWAGDEFLLLLPKFTTVEARTAIESSLCRFRDQLRVGATPVTLSCGIAYVSSKDEHLSALGLAEQLAQEAKANGRSQIMIAQ